LVHAFHFILDQLFQCLALFYRRLKEQFVVYT
jgi:hypothetical protein